MPAHIDVRRLWREALAAGVVVESGAPFCAGGGVEQHIRLGYASIPAERIEPGVSGLAKVVASLSRKPPVSAPPA